MPGVVAHLSKGEFARYVVNGNEITAGVGIKLKQLTAIARNAGIGGFEWMEGIPGNLGGSLRMNAGAMGAETFDQSRQRALLRPGRQYLHPPSCRDESSLPRCAHPSTKTMPFPPPCGGLWPTPGISKPELPISERKRRESQPIAASAGCIFKNPDQTPAGRLIEELGFKNFTVEGRAFPKCMATSSSMTAERPQRKFSPSSKKSVPPPRASAASISKPKCRSLEWTHDWNSQRQESRGTALGGPGSEREVSLRSGAAVARALQSLARLLRRSMKDPGFSLPSDVDLAYNMIHGTFGEDGQIQEILERRGVPYTGEGIKGSHLAFDKILSKTRFDEEGGSHWTMARHH